jgi:O-antigen biosynthesis protein WbqV
MKVTSRAFATFVHDVVMAALSFILSFYLRVGADIAHYSPMLLLTYDLAFAATAAIIFRWSGLYRGIWRFASLPDLLALLRAVTLIILIFFPVMFVVTRLQEMPRSLVGINWLLLMALLGGPRFAYRVIKDRGLDHVFESATYAPVPILLIGAREGADLFIRAIGRDPRRPYHVVGILADGEARVGRDIGGIAVMGTFDEIANVVARLTRTDNRPQRLIVCQELDRAAARRLLDFSGEAGIPLARVPRLTDFRETGDDLQRIEPVAIEDLLGRPQTVLDHDGMRALIAGRRVLITGAGGTIGGELTRQIASYGPTRLALVDNGEFALYTIDQEIKERFPEVPRQAIIADVRERRRIDEVMAAERPELVFHAAALKHVPMVEANPIEGIVTNALGTRNVAEASRAHGVAAMVMISTDKAVNPANVMGASKRLAESICQALDIVEARRDSGTRYVTVRFGNVLGSTGSVVPLFQRQLAAGGPLTVTHPDISRFFMTVREAVELVLQASALAGSESAARGKVFVLDMGDPVKIVDLATQMIRLAGKRPGEDIKIDFVGLRPGEKLYEELFYANEMLVPTKAAGIRLAAPRTSDYAMLARALDELAEHAREGREDRALALFRTLVPEYDSAVAPAERAAAREP